MRAVFLDRDGTLIHDVDYLADPAGVELLPGAAEALAELSAAGLLAVLVTNQSGIGRGYFSEEDYRRVHERLVEVLAERGARLDAAYHAPDAQDGGPDSNRKPGAGMYLRAAREHGVDLAASFYVGDRMRDVLAAVRFGGRALLVRGEKTELDQAAEHPSITVVESLAEAAQVILAEMRDRG